MSRFMIVSLAAWICITTVTAADMPKSAEDTEKEAIQALKNAKADFKFTPKEWHDQFKKDKDAEKAAKAKYRGKIIEIEGEVSFVTVQYDPPLAVIHLASDEKFASVRASCFPGNVWKTVVPKSKTAVRGYYHSQGWLLGDLYPAIVLSTDSKLDVFKADELVKLVAKDPKGASEKYKHHWCCVEGKFLKSDVTKNDVLTITIEGADGKDIQCSGFISNHAKAKIGTFKPGQIVKVYGDLYVGFGGGISIGRTFFD